MLLANPKQFICKKILCLKIVAIYKTHINKVNVENQVFNYYFNSSIEAKTLETKNILIDQKNYKNLVIGDVQKYLQIKIRRLYYDKLIGKIEEHEGKKCLICVMIIC